VKAAEFKLAACAALAEGVRMGQTISVLNNVDAELVGEFSDRSIRNHVTSRLEFNIMVAGKNFTSVGEAIVHAYRCGLAAMNSMHAKNLKSAVDQDELYKVLRKSQSLEHKADFLREIAKEWFPLDIHTEMKIKMVHLELNELADFLEK